MRAAVYERFNGPIAVLDVDDPVPGVGEVVVEVLAVGLCRSDLHGWRGTDPDIVCPHVGGHEFVGRVVALGAGVDHVGLGDRVVAPFVCGCGECEPCRSGNHQVCRRQEQPGFTMWGAFAEYCRIPYAADNAVAGARLAFGDDVNTVYRFDQADVVVSLDADFLSIGGAHVRYARDFIAKRRLTANG